MGTLRSLKDIKTIIFDWDGTLHESMIIYQGAFLKAYQFLVEKGYANKRKWKTEDIKRFLGMNPKEMWASFQPTIPEHIIQIVSPMISKEMKSSIDMGKARLYDGALHVLSILKSKGYHLVYLSNSKTYYKDAMTQAFHLENYFDHIICSEMYDYIPKHDILSQIKDQLPLGWMVVGDRNVDMIAGQTHHAFTVACDYGYGDQAELSTADAHIQEIKELLKILSN